MLATMNHDYATVEPARAEIDATPGALLLEFGAPWCPICRAAQAHIATAMQDCPDLRHIKIEDGPGRRLGRSFRIKLWPTLVFMQDGVEIARLVRPTSAAEITQALARLSAG